MRRLRIDSDIKGAVGLGAMIIFIGMILLSQSSHSRSFISQKNSLKTARIPPKMLGVISPTLY